MPARNSQEKIDELSSLYEEHGSYTKAAENSEYSRSQIYRAHYNSQGRCACGRYIEEEGYRTCIKCRERSLENTKKRRQKRLENNTCRECGKPLANDSVSMCEYHLEKNRVKCAELRQKRKEEGLCLLCGDPALEGKQHCKTHLQWKRCYSDKKRSDKHFDGWLFEVLNRDDNSCQICGREDSIHVHHVDKDKNEPHLMVCLCPTCHRAVTGLKASPHANKIIDCYEAGLI